MFLVTQVNRMSDRSRQPSRHRPQEARFLWLAMGLAVLTGLSVLMVAETPTWAAPRPQQLCNQALETTRMAQSVLRERARRLDWLAKLRSLATALQNQSEGPARNFRLRAVLAETREVAGRLKELDGERNRLHAQAKKLLARMKQAAQGLSGVRLGRIRSCMAALRRILPRPRPTSGHLARIVVRPDDGPAELARKANLLADSADKLELRMRRLERAIHRTERQVALQAATRRARQGAGLLAGGQRRRAVATISPTSRVRGTDPPSQGGTKPLGDPDHDGQDTSDDTFGTNGLGGGGSVRYTNPNGLTQTWSSVLTAVHDLVGPSQAQALAKQAASQDPTVRLAALRRALRLLAQSQHRLRQRANRLRAQAHRLSGPRPGPRHPRRSRAPRVARSTPST